MEDLFILVLAIVVVGGLGVWGFCGLITGGQFGRVDNGTCVESEPVNLAADSIGNQCNVRQRVKGDSLVDRMAARKATS